ncbi:MAG TPA: hydrogenase maturation nickel metallochaperone HypA [candidate division WOR-3 bacterium]|uniref:Hydrogenase maturation factor HypA n=1 Tax=candidate division WOR-3 bacterium TaxID=2052148 RepID=A0A9C9K0B2_UNCW3|nr:hydrogenase maturation nickel metallochaperone HypA [candidate division WOR-3 bacterium]
MHEFSVTKSLVDLCIQEAEKNNFKKVYKINLKIGKFTGFSPDSILFYFDYLKPNTRCSDAEIIFTEVPIRIKCRACGKENVIDEPILVCPDCGRAEIEILSGREFYIESIEGE